MGKNVYKWCFPNELLLYVVRAKLTDNSVGFRLGVFGLVVVFFSFF